MSADRGRRLAREGLLRALRASRVLPVITIADADAAVPLARTLAAAGLKAMEITLRTEASLAAIEAIASSDVQIVLGAGTVLTLEDLERSASAGAQFAVSPGSSAQLLSQPGPIPLIPGVATASEVMQATAQGFQLLKLFPAEASGGVALLRTLAGPFPDVRFVPTGGIDGSNATEYLESANTLCVGGSWLVPKGLLEAGDWAALERHVVQALAALNTTVCD